MKKATFLIFSTLIVSGTSTIGQSKLKFAHIDSQVLLMNIPERDSAENKIAKYTQEIQLALQEMNTEYENKLKAYTELPTTTSDFIKKDKELELQMLGQRIKSYQQNANNDIQKKQAELLNPIYEKIQNAISEIGKENGYIYIFDIKSLLYHSQQSTDITGLVRKKLGLQ